MAALPEGEPAFTITMYGITGGETAVEGARAADTIGALTLEFCAAKADGTLPETVRLALEGALPSLPPSSCACTPSAPCLTPRHYRCGT